MTFDEIALIAATEMIAANRLEVAVDRIQALERGHAAQNVLAIMRQLQIARWP